MKILFAHDHRFYKKKDQIFSEVEFGYTMWKRYLKVFDEVVIAARINSLSGKIDTSKMNVTSGPGVTSVAIPSISGIKNRIQNYKKAYQNLSKEIKEVDGVIARLPSEIGLLAIEICREINKPYYVELVGCPKDAYYYQGSLQGKLYSPYITSRTRKAVYNSKFVLYVTKKFLQERYPNNQKNIDCSNVELNIINEKINRLNVNKPTYKLGIIGSLETNYKGIDVAIRALKEIKSFNVVLHVVGKGNSKKWVELSSRLGVSDKVKFLGSMPSGEPILNWLDSVDIYLQPSKTEGLPRALVEAMSRKLPALASNVGGIPELLQQEFLHSSGDYKTLAEQIKMFLENHDLMEKEGLRNFDKSKEYAKPLLEEKRTYLLEQFKQFIEQGRM